MRIFIVILCLFSMIYAKDSIKNPKKDSNITNEQNIQKYPISIIKNNKILYKNIYLDFGVSTKKYNKKNILKTNIIASKTSHNLFRDSKNVCENLFILALKDLQSQAITIGGNKVINIISSRQNTKDKKNFYCNVGSIFSYVTLTGDVVK